jgi:hypothetical protein
MKTRHVFGFAFLVLGVIALLQPHPPQAAPGLRINSVSGTVAHTSTLTLTGAGFGTKPSGAAPLKYDDFENGTIGQTVGNGWIADNTYRPDYSNRQVRPNSTVSVRARWPASGIAADGRYDDGSNFGIGGFPIQRMYLDVWYYYEATPPYSRNHKIFRFHTNRDLAPNLYYNIYCQSQASGLIGQDGLANPGDQTGQWFEPGSSYFVGRWSHIQGYFEESSPGAQNGTVQIWIDGVQRLNRVRNIRTRDGNTHWDFLWFGNYLGRDAVGGCPSYTADAYTYWDAAYVDTTQARVEIGDASTWSATRHREIQIPSAWADGSIAVRLNRGSFANFNGLYLYVIDSEGNISPGYPLAGGAPAPAPTGPPAAPTGVRIVS